MAVPTYKKTIKRFMRTPKQKTYTFLGITLVVILIFLVGAILPTLSTISEIRGEISERETVDAQLQEKINAMQALQTAHLEKQEDLELVDVFFPEDSDYSLLMANLERISQKYGYDLNSVQISGQEEGKQKEESEYRGMEVVEVQISVTGSKTGMSNLLSHLENLPVVPQITRVSFMPDEDENSDIHLVVNMTIHRMSNESDE